MPLFEYRCQKCNAAFEELIRSADDPAAVACPQCKSRNTERLPSTFAARSAPSAASALPMGGGCGRCGDPDGPCGA